MHLQGCHQVLTPPCEAIPRVAPNGELGGALPAVITGLLNNSGNKTCRRADRDISLNEVHATA